ncbi:MAG: SRPBCC family protein [Actinobacteria bacterium]|nr:SRPBCC family protein [Actinomycetota bacterium]
MKTIRTVDSKVIPDIANYPSWWPSSVKIKTLDVSEELVGSCIEVRPFGGQAFRCEVSSANDGDELTMTYSGIYAGTGTWKVSELGEQTLVTYEIDLEIQSTLIRLLSGVLPVSSIHSRLMQDVLAGLERYLGDGAPA